MDSPSDIRCPACQTAYAWHWLDSGGVVQRLEPPQDDADFEDGADPQPDLSHTPVANPWAVLGVAQGSPWAEVARARRMLLQQYHPDRLGHVPPLVHKLAEDAFKRVNDAYDALKAQR
jgi:DnaJ-class molecular chaperone